VSRKATRRAGPARAGRLLDADSSAGTMEGRSLDNPMRGNPARLASRAGRVARTGKRRESRRQGQEGRARTGNTFVRADRSKVPEGPDAATRPKVVEGSGERPGSRDFDRILSPRRRPLAVRRRGADHAPVPCAESRPRGTPTRLRRAPGATPSSEGTLTQRSREPRGARRSRHRKVAPAPEDQANHIPVRRTVAAPKGARRADSGQPARVGRTSPSVNL